MDNTSPRTMTKSALALAKTALQIAKKALPAYSHRNSPKKFTQHQLFAVLVLREFFHFDYRGLEQLLKDWSDLRDILDLKAVPDYSTLCYAQERLLKKGLLSVCWMPASDWLGNTI